MRAAMLTTAEIQAYHRDGQVTPTWRLPDPLLDRMRGSLERLIAARPEVRPDFIALPHVPWNTPGAREIAREFFEYTTNPDFLDIVEALIEPDIILWASTMFCADRRPRSMAPG
jgi:hypothetical protein